MSSLRPGLNRLARVRSVGQRAASTVCLVFLCALVLASGIPSASGQDAQNDQKDGSLQRAAENIRNGLMRWTVPSSRLTDGPNVRKAFRDVVEEARKATVRVKVDGKDTALGGIVGPDGWILTKASRVAAGEVTCKLQDGRELEARLVGVQQPFDLAMLKVEAQRLPTLRWSASSDLRPGQWVATPSLVADPIGVGVVGTGSRKINKQAGILGVTRAPDGNTTRIDRVSPGSGADKAGIQVNDEVTQVEGVEVKTWDQLVRQIRQFGPGETVEMTIRRGNKTITVHAKLSSIVEGMQPSRRQKQNNMGGPLSVRRYGFPTAFQHDIVLRPTDCGGPLVDLEGQVLGFNIARGGRTESYAIPSSTLMQLMYPLMSGQLLPEEAQLVSAQTEVKSEKNADQAAKDEKSDKKEAKPDKKEPAKQEKKRDDKPAKKAERSSKKKVESAPPAKKSSPAVPPGTKNPLPAAPEPAVPTRPTLPSAPEPSAS